MSDTLDSLRALALCELVWWEAYQEGHEVSVPSRSWWIVEAVVWSALVMSFVGFQLGSQSLCLRAMSVLACFAGQRYGRPI